MLVKIKHISLYLFVVFTYAIVLFCYGFFPLSFSPPTKSTIADLPSSLDNVKLDPDKYKPRISRAVLMIIDAFRTDFVTQKSSMQFLNELIDNGTACRYQLQVHPPTVTMPRIKAMTSGAIPSFLDVILNLGSPEMKLDTFLYQMFNQQQRIVFYGDNTWTNMFPHMFHREAANEDSLYVNDFYEGDTNITTRMRNEFYNYDWKLMILHYLGLDHIGHVEGPFSEKVPSKLKEMDNVIKEIFVAMHKWDEKFYTKSLLLVTGDHGMRDSGGHGGSTHQEMYVPLIAVGSNCTPRDEIFLQIDMAPTLATLMGVAIPFSSIGSLIEPILNDIPPVEKMYLAHYNTKRLIEKAKMFYEDRLKEQDFFIQYKEAKLLHSIFLEHQGDLTIMDKALRKYGTISRSLSRQLIRNYIRYDMLSIVIAIALGIATAVLSMLMALIPYSIKELHIQFKFTRWILISIIGLAGLHLVYKFSSVESTLLQNVYVKQTLLVTIFSCVFIHWSLYGALLPLINFKSLLKSFQRLPGLLFLLGSVFHMMSLSSSSFIEEEHQPWYYFSNSLFVLLTLLELRIMNQTISQINHVNTNEVLLLHCRRERDEFCISAILFFCGHTTLRRWNQTGDKWQHIPDIGDWLGKEENKCWLSFILFFGLCYVLMAISRLSGFLTTILSMTACLLIYYYRLMTGAVNLHTIAPSKTNSCLTIFWINLLEIFLIDFLPKVYRIALGKPRPKSSQMLVSIISIMALLSSLLHKPHNVVLVAALLSSSRYITARIDHIAESKTENLLLKIISHIWLGKLFYFYQGNSNNLATIDLNAGYVGLSSFNFTRVGLFLTLNTFNGQILSYLLLTHHLLNGCQRETVNKAVHVEQNRILVSQAMLKLLSLVIIAPLTFYIIIVALMRNHIFVWTVFSPKIIYDCFYLGLTLPQLVTAYFVFK